MVLYLAEHLNVPLRERNALLLASGHAPVYSHRALDDGGSDMRYVLEAIERLLASHDPYPAFVIDRQWNVVARNASTAMLINDVALELLVPPVNALRLALHPSGLAPQIVNLAKWSAYLLRRLDHQMLTAPDARLAQLAGEARRYPGVAEPGHHTGNPVDRVFVPLHLTNGLRSVRLRHRPEPG